MTGYEVTGTYKNKAVAITDPYLDVYATAGRTGVINNTIAAPT